MSSSVNGAHAEGFLLLTLPNCTISTPTTGSQTGTLALQCVTLDVPFQSTPERDVWLVLKLNTFEMIISPTQRINYSRTTYTYMFLPEDEHAGPVQLTAVPNPSNPASYQDLETMEVVLSQYGVVHDIESGAMDTGNMEKGELPSSNSSAGSKVDNGIGPSDFKGHLVLMDENDGEVVATLDYAVPIKEDKALAAFGHEKDPVVIDLPGEEEEMAGRREAYAYPANPEERDMLMKTAGLISRGIVLATSAISSGITAASNYYITHSTSTSRPIEFSPRTRANMRRIHKISGKAVTVTEKTTGAIFKTLDHVAGKLGGSSTSSASGSRSPSRFQLAAPPPLPRRSGSPGAPTAEAPPMAPGAPPTGFGTPPDGYGKSPMGYETPPTGYMTPTRSITPGMAPPLPQRKPRLLNRLLASTDLILTTLDQSAKELIASGTHAVSASLTHKYGQDMGDVSRMAGQSVQNVGLVYIDVRGVGRRALLKRAGKAVVSARMGGREVLLGPQAQAGQPHGVTLGAPPAYSEVPLAKGGSPQPGGPKS